MADGCVKLNQECVASYDLGYNCVGRHFAINLDMYPDLV